MGKSLTLLVFAGVLSASILFFQASQTSHDTTETQATYHELILANQVAESALALAKVQAKKAGSSYNQALLNVRSITPVTNNVISELELNGGMFQATASPIDGQNMRIEVLATYGNAMVTLADYHRVDMLMVEEPSRLYVKFLESASPNCSALWLEQLIPVNPGDTFDPDDGQLSSNGEWFIHEPEMVFEADHYRTLESSSTSLQSVNLEAGTRINMFIAVDTDCSEQGTWVNDYNPTDYDWVHHAFNSSIANLSRVEEGPNALIDAHYSYPQKWRLAFEDTQTFTDIQRTDVKAHGYGSGAWDAAMESYGGTGWTIDGNGYKTLGNHASLPDFSDQVMEIKLISCGGVCPPEGTELDD